MIVLQVENSQLIKDITASEKAIKSVELRLTEMSDTGTRAVDHLTQVVNASIEELQNTKRAIHQYQADTSKELQAIDSQQTAKLDIIQNVQSNLATDLKLLNKTFAYLNDEQKLSTVAIQTQSQRITALETMQINVRIWWIHSTSIHKTYSLNKF